jgi:isoleucyl-tRNA synthetase
MPAVKRALLATHGASLLAQLRDQGQVTLELEGETLTLDQEDIEVRLQAKEGWTAAQGPHVVVVLSTELTPQLIREGYAQDLKRLIQERRKALQCQYTDRIRVGLETERDELWGAVRENLDYLLHETLATEILRGPLRDVEPVECEVADATVIIYVQVCGE